LEGKRCGIKNERKDGLFEKHGPYWCDTYYACNVVYDVLKNLAAKQPNPDRFSRQVNTHMLSFTKKEKAFLKKLNTPAKVQDFLNLIPFNYEKNGVDRVKSPVRVLREKSAHCIEGAIFSAHVLSLHGHKPFILLLKSTKNDLDHVIAPFKIDGFWGAISKTNHAVLRYREPVYKNIRELVMSYFHEYFLNDGTKTLRSYSGLLNLNIFEKGFECGEEDLWGIDEELDNIRHYKIVPKKLLKNFGKKLRKTDKVERRAGLIVEWKR